MEMNYNAEQNKIFLFLFKNLFFILCLVLCARCCPAGWRAPALRVCSHPPLEWCPHWPPGSSCHKMIARLRTESTVTLTGHSHSPGSSCSRFAPDTAKASDGGYEVSRDRKWSMYRVLGTCTVSSLVYCEPLCLSLYQIYTNISYLPRIIVETSFMYFLDHLRSQYRGEFVSNPRRQLASLTRTVTYQLPSHCPLTWVGVSHVAEVAALASQGSHEEACQVGQSPHEPSLWRILFVKDTVVDDVILKQMTFLLIDVLLSG